MTQQLDDCVDHSSQGTLASFYRLAERAVVATLDGGKPNRAFKLWSVDWLAGDRTRNVTQLACDCEHRIYRIMKEQYGPQDPRTARAKAREFTLRAALVLDEMASAGFEGPTFSRGSAWLPQLVMSVEVLYEKARLHEETPGIPVSIDAALASLKERGAL